MQATVIVLVTLTGALGSQSPLQARETSRLATARNYGNYAAEGTSTDAHGLPAGQVIASGFTTVLATTSNTSAETVIGWETAPGDVVMASVSEQATGWALNGAMDIGTMASAAGRSNEGPHDLRLHIRGPAGARGKIELWAMGFATAGGRVAIAVDVGDDGVIDFAYAAVASVLFERRQWDVSLGAAGRLDVLLRTDGQAVVAMGRAGTYFTGMTVRFVPGAFCDIVRAGPTCGASLTGHDTSVVRGTRDLVLELNGAPPAAPGILVVGSQIWSVPIPGANCLLQTDPAIMLPFVTDLVGDALHALALPGSALPLQLRFQDVMVVGSRLTSSNGVAVTCRP